MKQAARSTACCRKTRATAIRETVVAREEERFGGIKIGSAFFGWLVSTAMAVLLVALVTAAGRAGILPVTDPLARAGQRIVR